MQENEINFQNFDINSPSDNGSEKSENKKKKGNEEEKEEKGCHFPLAYTVLIIIQFLVFFLTYLVQKGKYDRIEYSKGYFIIHSYGEDDRKINATKSILEEYKIKIPFENFEKGYITEPISIPGTYKKIDQEKANISYVLIYLINGLIESGNLSFFIMILGGVTSILTEMNVLNSGMKALSRITKGKEFLLLCLVFIVISIGGTTFGMSEEIFGFYPILMPIFLESGLDGILSTACLFMGSCIGIMFSTVNAFSVVLGSYSAGISFTDHIVFRVITLVIGDILTILYFYLYYRKIKLDEKKSIVYEIKDKLESKFLNKKQKQVNNEGENENLIESQENKDKKNEEEFTLIQKIALLIFIVGFIIMVFGVIAFNWWFEQMSALLVLVAIILMFLSRLGEEKAIKAFLTGVGDFCGIALIMGMARGINITLDKESISDTILNSLSNLLDGLPKVVFAVIMLFVFIIVGIFIQSTVGLAVLSMPVIAPLADQVNCPRDVVVNAYMYGQAFISLIAPTGYILIILQMVGVQFNYWLKFIWPFMVIILIYLIILIIISCFI